MHIGERESHAHGGRRTVTVDEEQYLGMCWPRHHKIALSLTVTSAPVYTGRVRETLSSLGRRGR